MIVDFKEIPASNSSAGDQDQFELFARDFVAVLGYTIIEHPDRGADGGRDVLVGETLTGIRQSGHRKWLLSAKHNAHSGKSVGESSEQNIRDRVERHGADGFMGFYSTLPSSGLSTALRGLEGKILVDHFDRGLIEQTLITNPKMESVFRAYFPLSYLRFQSMGGYPATTKDLATTFTGGNAFPVLRFSVGAGVLPHIKNEGDFTLYDLDVKIAVNLKDMKHDWRRPDHTFPFLHPGTGIVCDSIGHEKILESQRIDSVTAARNGRFHQITTFALFEWPPGENSPKTPSIHQSTTQIYWQQHNSNQQALVYNVSGITDGHTGLPCVELPWDPKLALKRIQSYYGGAIPKAT